MVAVVVKRQRCSLPLFRGEPDLSCLLDLRASFLFACSCFRAMLSDLSTAGKFFTNSVASRLSSDGSLSLPLLESPLPARRSSLFALSSAIRVYLICKACWLKILASPSELGSVEKVLVVLPRVFIVLTVGMDISSCGTSILN